MRDYALPEDAGEQNNLIFIIKENGMESEQFLPIIVQLTNALVDPAERGRIFVTPFV